MTLSPRRHYCQQLLQLYTLLPDTPQRPRPLDRQLAAQLFARQVPLTLVEAAFLLASARRLLRDTTAPPLPAIRSLHYFLPVIDELRHQPLPPDYVGFLRSKLAPALAAKKSRQAQPAAAGASPKNYVSS